jgi:hypothetical protein
MDLAVAMASTPAHVPDELRTALESRVGRAAYVEITATVAWGNHRARLNRALGVRESRVLRGSILCVVRHKYGTTVPPGAWDRVRVSVGVGGLMMAARVGWVKCDVGGVVWR